MRKPELTEAQVRALRLISESAGQVAVTGEMALAIQGLLSTRYVAISITDVGYVALRECDPSVVASRRLVCGMSDAGRAALAEQEKGDG